jgi:hypothetical protein
MIQAMIEGLPCNADDQISHIGEVRQTEPAGRVLLTKDDVLLRAVDRPPGADPAFQGAADAFAEIGMAAAHLGEDTDRAQFRGGLEHWHNLAVPEGGEGIGSAPAPRRLLRCHTVGILFDPISGCGADPGPGRSNGRGVGLAVSHVKPYLTVGTVAARQGRGVLIGVKTHDPAKARCNRQPASCPVGKMPMPAP